jgi:hypothetical protein
VIIVDETQYYWVRVYDYNYERDTSNKGTMIDEFYVEGMNGREEAKIIVKEKYCSPTSNEIKFAKPKKTNGIYANITDSNKFFYDRFYVTINTVCFWCTKQIKGKASEFPRDYLGNNIFIMNDFTSEDTVYFCKHDCKSHFNKVKHNHNEGEFQVKEEGQNGNVFGYVYLIYNRAEDVYYVGQTRYMPFFRWQEHIKDGGKGDISDLSFSVLSEIYKDKKQTDDYNQLYLNSIEAWWIAKYQTEGHKVLNITKPKITIQHLKDKFNDMVLKQKQLQLDL